jgi:hypothetical protein
MAQKKKNTAEEGYEIRGECVWVVYVDSFYIGEANLSNITCTADTAISVFSQQDRVAWK